MPTDDHSLAGRVALVPGATRGCGRATAVELGALGATVYGSGRSTRAGRSPMDRPKTIEDTAELVSAAGGEGVAVRCDHADADDVGALVERIRSDHGRLDILVNDVWGGDPFVQWGKSVWEHRLDATLGVLRNGIETHLITSHFAIPLMLEGTGGLVVEVGDGQRDVPYRTNMPYDLVKTAVVRIGEALTSASRRRRGARRPSEPPTSATPRRRICSAAGSPPWRPTPTGSGTPDSASAPGSSCTSTASPTSTGSGRIGAPSTSRPVARP